MIDVITAGWLISGLSIWGAVLNALRIKWGFIFWIFANINWILYNIATETYSQIPIWVVFTIISVWGFWVWNKEEYDDVDAIKVQTDDIGDTNGKK